MDKPYHIIENGQCPHCLSRTLIVLNTEYDIFYIGKSGDINSSETILKTKVTCATCEKDSHIHMVNSQGTYLKDRFNELTALGNLEKIQKNPFEKKG